MQETQEELLPNFLDEYWKEVVQSEQVSDGLLKEIAVSISEGMSRRFRFSEETQKYL